MANHKKKPGYQGCKLCRQFKAQGNSKQDTRPKCRLEKALMA